MDNTVRLEYLDELPNGDYIEHLIRGGEKYRVYYELKKQGVKEGQLISIYEIHHLTSSSLHS